MSFGAITGAVLGSAASAWIGGKMNKSGNSAVQGRLGATDEQLRMARINDVQSTGFSSTLSIAPTGIRTINFERSAGVQSALDEVMNRSAAAAGDFSDLRGKVAPGFSDLRKSSLDQLAFGEKRAVGGLRESLRERRLAGSSFENMAVSEERERFERLRQEVLGGLGVAEIEMTANLIAQELEASLTGLGAMLEQFNFESQLAAGIQSAATALKQTVTAARAGIGEAGAYAQSAANQGQGALWEPVISGIGDLVTEGAKKLFHGTKPESSSGGGVK